MPEDIGELAQKIEQKYREIKPRFQDMFGMLPQELRSDLAMFLDELKVEPESVAGLTIQARHIYTVCNFLSDGLKVEGRRNWCIIGYPPTGRNVKEFLASEPDPEQTTFQIMRLLDEWYGAFTRKVDSCLDDNPMVLEMFHGMISLKRSHKEVVAERDRLKEELASAYHAASENSKNRLAEREETVKRIREAVESLKATKGIFKSKAIRQIREDLERMLTALGWEA